ICVRPLPPLTCLILSRPFPSSSACCFNPNRTCCHVLLQLSASPTSPPSSPTHAPIHPTSSACPTPPPTNVLPPPRSKLLSSPCPCLLTNVSFPPQLTVPLTTSRFFCLYRTYPTYC
ncbi:uncharacterized protein SCHCODRAFT_02484372, partial [Schizophyllum commune H4-8]|uniref:uncharacterized protein n=1 Tax=Schizophyllum commune (strain H4-8 / FGSC 9210) TaxID=578458 RepID=UPI00215E0861